MVRYGWIKYRMGGTGKARKRDVGGEVKKSTELDYATHQAMMDVGQGEPSQPYRSGVAQKSLLLGKGNA